MTPAGDSVWSTLPRGVSGRYARRGGGGGTREARSRWKHEGRDGSRRGPSRPGRNRTCNPRFWRTPSNAGVAAFVDFQALSAERTTPASLDDAGVGTNPGTEIAYGQNLRRGLRIS